MARSLNEDGLDPDCGPRVDQAVWRHQGGFSVQRPLSEAGAIVLEEDCDILIPAALEGVIKSWQLPTVIRAPLIIEAANGPITAGADQILRDKGIVIISRSLCQCRRGHGFPISNGSRTCRISASGACNAANEEAHANGTGARVGTPHLPISNLEWELAPDFQEKIPARCR